MEKRYYFPLQQGIGAFAQSLVAPGESVRRGQMIAKCPDDALGSNCHSSVSGVVQAVDAAGIAILADAVQSEEYIPLQSETPWERIKEAGIIGLGGAGFPTHVKLAKPLNDGIVIVNGVECEPILGHNIRYMETKPSKVIRGLQIAMEIVGAGRGAIAVKAIHPEAIASLEQALQGTENIKVHGLPNLYPMGEERAVIREVLGILLPVDALPLQANAIVINAETAYRIAEAVDERKPLIDKDITVAGKINGDLIQIFFDVPLGISVGEMIKRAGGVSTEDYGELIMGGPFTGHRTQWESPIIKTCGGILVTEQFFRGPDKIGLLVCACGADRERLAEIAQSMGSEVVAVEYCKQALETRGSRKCENPGRCPGQVGKVLAIKKAGAKAVLISNCTDCSNTVMGCAPQLKLAVYHCTDGALRAVNHPLVRKFKGGSE